MGWLSLRKKQDKVLKSEVYYHYFYHYQGSPWFFYLISKVQTTFKEETLSSV